MNEGGDPGTSSGDHRTRRPHTKSRYGCTKCKGRRIKCDELTPRCSRCSKMGLTCTYPDKKRQGDSPGSSGNSPASAGSPLSSLASQAPPLLLPPLESELLARTAQSLTRTEVELLEHFLEHTSRRDRTVDDDDQYTLQIGIPNLACQSRPLMRSVLALAAVCKCSDIILAGNNTNQHPVSPLDRARVIELLELAQQYHMESLQGIQATLHNGARHCYDHVLANAAMMGMYGTGSHRVRIWLAKTADPFNSRDEYMPKHPQWIDLFRAVDLAYIGLLNDTPGVNLTPPLSPPAPPVVSCIASSNDSGLRMRHRESSALPPSRDPEYHALRPILAATVGSALAKLRERARGIQNTSNDADMQACFTALALLDSVAAKTFPASGISRPSSPGSGFGIDKDGDVPPGRLSEVSPWLRRYTARITSTIPSNLPRRNIAAFLHKAPARYLRLAEEMIGLIQADLDVVGDMLDADMDVDGIRVVLPPDGGTCSMAHQLALDIFAHWLVLVVLLDGVWWIGGIGAWELDRIVTFFGRDADDVRWRDCLWNRCRDWWPASMLEVSRQFDKHRTEG